MHELFIRFADDSRSHGLHIEEFSGGGGASLGYKMATGRDVDFAVNHDREATAMHRINNLKTRHRRKNVWEVDPIDALREMGISDEIIRGWLRSGFLGFLVDSGWFSPDCKHFSKAKGASLFDKRIRGLAYIMVKWAGRGGALRVAPGKAGRVRRRGPACPRVMFFENVEEFKTWGPLIARRCPHTGRVVKRDKSVASAGEIVPYRDQWLVPDPKRKGLYFRRWIRQLEEVGAVHRFEEERACDFGAPTIRKRLYGVIKFDGSAIAWPEKTHAAPDSDAVRSGALQPWRTAAECIDWTLPCPSIFLTREQARKVKCKRPLVAATLRRIAKGIERYVLKASEPFLVSITHHDGDNRVEPLSEPARTVTAANRGEKGLIAPCLAVQTSGHPGAKATDPLCTIATGGHHAVVAPYMVQRYGERQGQEPRAISVTRPMPVVVPTQNGGTLAAAHMLKFRGDSEGTAATDPVPTVTANSFVKRPGGSSPIGICATSLVKLRGDVETHAPGSSACEPTHTISASGTHHAISACYLAQHNGGENGHQTIGHDAREPISALTSKCSNQAVVGASMVAYFGSEQDGQPMTDPVRTTTVKPRFGLATWHGVIPPLTPELAEKARRVAAFLREYGVQFEGEFATVGDYVIVDIGMRMLTPRELFRAQSFPDSYIIDRGLDELPDGTLVEIELTITAQIKMCGNSVCPVMAEAFIRANTPTAEREQEAAA